jgi:UDPglucose 6-dehydrogenase
MRIGIVGHGVVGSAMARFFSRSPLHQVEIYDKFQPAHGDGRRKELINGCDLVFVSVPTPVGSDGFSCDTSAVEECVSWLVPPICIRSTIVPGTVDRLAAMAGKEIAFSPEYIGEQPGHPWLEEGRCGFVIVGGPSRLYDLVAAAYDAVAMGQIRYYFTTARAAELCKYMENCFLAAKVAFVNQFYDIAQSLDVDFEEVRDLWLVDPRVGQSHSAVTRERGFRGRCLPKDVAAITALMRKCGGAPLLEAIMAYNNLICQTADRQPELADPVTA